MSTNVHVVRRQRDAHRLRLERNRQPRPKPTYEELEIALRDALARIELMEEYAGRSLQLAGKVVSPWRE